MSGFLPWPPVWLQVWFMIPEAQEGQAWVRAAIVPGSHGLEARTVLAIADSGLSGLAWRLPQWPVCPLSHPP